MMRGAFDQEVEKVLDAPSRALKEGSELVKQGETLIRQARPFARAEEYWDDLGPGLTTGAADDDPSGIATYSQAGAKYGLQLIWLSLFTFPFMAVVQEMCARIGLVTGQGLAANIRQYYSARTLFVVTGLLFLANVFNIAADLGAMSAATRLLIPGVSFEAWVVVFAAFSLLLQIYTPYARYSKYLKYLTLALFSYAIVAFSSGLDWGAVLTHTLIPSVSFTQDQLLLICGILGTTISPYLFFWQTSQEVEEEILKGETTIEERRAQVSPQSLKRMRIDVWSGMFFSNLITFCIFAACAGTLYAHGVTNIVTADQAALALRPFGEFAFLLFAVGIVGTGLLAVPVLAGSAAYAIAESFGWKYGLYRSLNQAYAFYGVIIVAMLIGILANFLHLDPMKGLIYAAVANGVIAPVILFFVVRLSSKQTLMGTHANRPFTNIIGWVTIGIMALSGIAALVTFAS